MDASSHASKYDGSTYPAEAAEAYERHMLPFSSAPGLATCWILSTRATASACWTWRVATPLARALRQTSADVLDAIGDEAAWRYGCVGLRWRTNARPGKGRQLNDATRIARDRYLARRQLFWPND